MATYNEEFLYEGDMKMALEHPTMKQILTKFESDSPDYGTVLENDVWPVLNEKNYEEEECYRTINPNEIFNNNEETTSNFNSYEPHSQISTFVNSSNEIGQNTNLFPTDHLQTPTYSNSRSIRPEAVLQDHTYTSLQDSQEYSQTNLTGIIDLDQSSYCNPLTPNSISNLNIKEEDHFETVSQYASTPHSSYSGIMSPAYSIDEPYSPAESSISCYSPGPSKQQRKRRQNTDGYVRKPRESLLNYSDYEKKERVRQQNNGASHRYRQRKNESKKEKEQRVEETESHNQILREQLASHRWNSETICDLLTEARIH